jgi:hypothetical protein
MNRHSRSGASFRAREAAGLARRLLPLAREAAMNSLPMWRTDSATREATRAMVRAPSPALVREARG